MKLGTPIVIIMLPIIWIYLIKYFKISGNFAGSKEVIDQEIKAIGKLSSMEKRVFVVFLFTAIAWVFRRDIVLDSFVIPGWSSLLGIQDYVHDSTVAIIAALLLFAIPAGKDLKNKKQKTLLDWKSASKVPWGVVMIVGGGYAIADSFNHTGLADFLGSKMSFIGEYPARASCYGGSRSNESIVTNDSCYICLFFFIYVTIWHRYECCYFWK